MTGGSGAGGVRIAELVGTLSYAADLGLGQPMEHSMRRTVIALRLAELVGATQPERETTYYLGLMMNAYCHADAAEQALWFGDDISFKGDGFDTLGMNTAQMIAFLLRRIGTHGGGRRPYETAAQLSRHRAEVDRHLPDHPLHPGRAVRGQDRAGHGGVHAIGQAYEQWDGHGQPRRLRGEQISLPARLVQLAGPVEVFVRRRGLESARAMVRRRSGAEFDPAWSICSAAMPPKFWRVWTRLPGGR